MAGFPNVPIAPGVPTIPRDPLAVADAIVLITQDVVSGFLGALSPQWGLFLNGLPVVVADSVQSFDYKADWSISDYPIEKGAFESYDKVTNPFDVRIRFMSGGGDLKLQALLDSIDAIAPGLDLLDAVTPTKVYASVNVDHVDYRRTATEGLGLLVVDVWCKQVRVTATAAFTNTQQPSGAAAVDGGIVQAAPASAGQARALPLVM